MRKPAPKLRKKLLFVVLFLVLGISIVAYFFRHRKIRFVANNSTELYEPELSTLYFPVDISVKDLEKLTNEKVHTILSDTKQPMGNGKDSIYMKVTRTGEFKFNLENAQLKTKVPLRVDVVVVKKIGKGMVQLFKKNPISFKIVVHLNSAIGLYHDVRLKTKTKLAYITWVEEPSTKIIGIPINLKKLAEKQLMEHAPNLVKMVDRVIKDHVYIKGSIEKIWNDLQKSKAINKEMKGFYFKVQPHDLAVYVDKSKLDSLRLNLKVQAKMYIRTEAFKDSIKHISFPSKITLLDTFNYRKKSDIYFHALLPLKDLNEVMIHQLKGKKINLSGLNVQISDLKLKTGKFSIVAYIEVKGDVNGTVIMKGFPKFNNENGRILIKNIGIESKLNEDIINNVSNLLHSEIIQLMKQYAEIDVEDQLASVPQLVEHGLIQSKINKKADVSIKEIEIRKAELKLLKDNVQLLFAVETDFEIGLKKEGLHPSKKSKKKAK